MGRGSAIPQRVTLIADQRSVSVDGMTLATLQGEPPAFDEGDLRGHLVSPLYDVLVEKAAQAKDLGEAGKLPPFDGVLVLVIDGNTKFGVVRDIQYTASQAQFGDFVFVGVDPSGAKVGVPAALPTRAPPGTPPPPMPQLGLTVLIRESGLELVSPALPAEQDWTESLPLDYGALSARARSLHDRFPDEEHVVVVPQPETPLATLIAILAALHSDEKGTIFASPIIAGVVM